MASSAQVKAFIERMAPIAIKKEKKQVRNAFHVVGTDEEDLEDN